MNPHTRAALDEALDDEYKASATYSKVIEVFGQVRPFINIIESEDRHISALLSLYRKFGLTPPEDKWDGKIEAPATLADACRAAVEGGIENAAMYERLLATIDDTDVREVLERLQAASRDNHLPAFRRCVAREDNDLDRRGYGGGRGYRGGHEEGS
jgi:rubrerythrin